MTWRKPLWRLVVIGLLLAAGAAWWVWQDYRRFLTESLDIPQEGFIVTVERGDSVQTVARQLEQAGLLDRSYYLLVYARLSGTATRLKVGEYLLMPGSTVQDIVADMVAGRVLQYSLTIPEGWTFRQMLSAVQSHPHIKPTLLGLSDAEIMAKLGHPEQHPEGLFFPDTYHFPRGLSDLEFLRRAYNIMQVHLNRVWAERKENLPLADSYKALILASIIEKETGLDSERREVAGVFIRRLQKGMRLQTDPTVIYGLGEDFDGNLRRRDLQTDQPYNTYTRSGLPPTPIALPGLASLQAAVDPLPGDTLYFVATGEGGHVFSKTLREHNRAVRKYQLKR